LFLALTAVTLTSLLVTVFLLTETYFPKKATVEREPVSSEPPASSQKNNIFKEMLDVLKDKVFAIYILASTLGLSLEFLFGEYGGIRLHNEMETQPLLTGLPWFGDVSGVEMFGNLKMENTFLVVLIAPLIALLTRRLSNRSSLLGGLVLYAAGFAVLGVSTTPWVLLLAMLVVTIGELMHIPVKQAFLGDLAPEDRRSSYLAVNGISFVGSMQIAAIGVFVGGFLSSWVMSVCFVGVGLISVVLFGRILPELERRQSGVTDAPAVVKMEEIGPSV
ncbi:MAG TPA: MFS transporter, partial [Bacilli bacterium]|nr:MFS transporter [Bacilli bacterium]